MGVLQEFDSRMIEGVDRVGKYLQEERRVSLPRILINVCGIEIASIVLYLAEFYIDVTRGPASVGTLAFGLSSFMIMVFFWSLPLFRLVKDVKKYARDDRDFYENTSLVTFYAGLAAVFRSDRPLYLLRVFWLFAIPLTGLLAWLEMDPSLAFLMLVGAATALRSYCECVYPRRPKKKEVKVPVSSELSPIGVSS